MISVRQILVSLGLAFTAYLAARGLWGIGSVPEPALVVAALGFYLVTTWLCILWQPRVVTDSPSEPDNERPDDVDALPVVHRGPAPAPMAAWAAALAFACAVIVPTAISFGVGPDGRTQAFGTWYLGGIGALMLVVMVRRRPWVAWGGILALAVASMIWMGPLNALALGLVGSILWVAIAQQMLMSTDRAARDTTDLTQLERAASVWQASQSGRQRERRIQVQRALTVAGPVLTRTVATGGKLEDHERLEARLAEGRLRDELRGPRLLDDDVRAEFEKARRRGASVTVLDEGGLDGIAEESLAVIRAELAETLRDAGSDRLYIRTSPHDSVAVTVVGRSGAARGLSDEDAVDLWREITHPKPAE